MSSTTNNCRGGEYATSRRGGPDSWERAFVEQKRQQGVSDFAIANMLGRPLATVLALPRAAELPAAAPEPEQDDKPVLTASAVVRKASPAPTRKPRSREMPKRVRQAIEAHAAIHLVTLEDLKGNGRGRHISWARQEAIWICRNRFRKPNGEPLYSLPLIGSWFNRDHTTVMHAVTAHTRRTTAWHGEWRTSARKHEEGPS